MRSKPADRLARPPVRRWRRSAILGVAFAIGAVGSPVTAQEAGRVIGRAVEAESRRGLEGASVTLRGTSWGAVTDAAGRFVLARVPAGQYTAVLEYIGREPQTTEVTVRAGGTSALELAAPIAAVGLEGITAIGARALTQAEALNRQKNAPNVVNIVASDQIGRFPDASAPEAVQRLPGVAVARDQGEGRYIQIRGGSPANTQVSFNGIQVPSPEGDNRQIALDAVPVDVLESIEVAKAILPDMDADAIGGAVNLVTRKAPAARILSFEAAGGYATIRDEPAGSGALTFGDRTSDGRLGLLVSGSYSRRNFGSDDIEPSYDLGDAGLADDALEQLEMRHYTLWRARLGGTATLDYQPNENNTFALTAIYSELQDEEQRRVLLHAVEDNELAFQHKNRRENLRTYNLALSGEHFRPGGAKLDYSIAWTRSLEDTPFDTEIGFLQEDVSFSPDLGNGDRIQANPRPGAIDGTYAFEAIEPARSDTRDTDLVGSVDLSLPYQAGDASSGNVKLGLKIRDKTKLRDVNEEEFELGDGAESIMLGQGVGTAFGGRLSNPASYAFPPFSTTPDEVRTFTSQFGAQLEGSHVDEADTEDYDLDERVIAGYVMVEMNLSPSLLLLPGVRYEHARVTTRGFDYDPEAETLTPESGERSHGRLFPMVHARYALTPRTNLRAAVTTAIARPNFFDLVPYRIRDDEDLEIGNPDIDPTTSANVDVLIEHYDDRIGVLSAGVFYKRLTDPIFFFTEDNDLGGETTQPRNGESGWIRGVELAVQRQLRFLPGVLSGVGVYANYTYTDSEATLPDGRLARLQGQADHVFNTALSYERSGFSGQISANYHADFVEEYAGEAAEDRFADRHLQFDLSASYRATPRATIFLEMVNLTDEPYVAFQGVRERPVQLEYYERWARLGARLTW